jgi:hypothetical protein
LTLTICGSDTNITLVPLNWPKGHCIDVDTCIKALESNTNTKLAILSQNLFSKRALPVKLVPIQIITSCTGIAAIPRQVVEVIRRPRETVSAYHGASIVTVIVDDLVDANVAFEGVAACSEGFLVKLLVEIVLVVRAGAGSGSKQLTSGCRAFLTMVAEAEGIRVRRHYPWRSCAIVKVGIDEISRLSFGGCSLGDSG